MMLRRRALALVFLAAIPVIAAAQLNPTVKVLARPKSAVPAECDEGLAIQPVQRLTTEERTSVRDTSRDMLAPPTASLRTSLEAAVVAAQQSSRQAFRDALTQSKSLLASYPPGGERTAASNLIEVLDDVDRIWEYQFTSATGAFFDSSSEPFRIASRYRGYDTAIRRQIITDQNGNKFYPTHETRDFLIAESGQRLPRVTGKPAPRPVSSSRGTTTTSARPPVNRQPSTVNAPRATVTTTAPSSERTTKPKPHHTMKQTTTHATRPAHRRAAHKPVVQEARATPAPARSAPVHTTAPATELAPAHPPVVSDTGAAPPPATSSASTASTETAPAATATTATATETTATNATTAPTDSNPAEKPAPSRSLLGPILLIIVGVGLLLTLWRASS